MILVHEFGHFVTARWIGVKVEEFSIGIGPLLRSWISKGIKYSLRAFPIGGFVKMFGEEDMDIKKKGSFGGKNPWQRLLIIISGVFMNFITVILITYIIGFFVGFEYRVPIFPFQNKLLIGVEVERPVIIGIADNSPAEENGLKVNEIIEKFNGEDVESVDDFVKKVSQHKGERVTISLIPLLGGERKSVTLTPRVNYPEDEGPMGVQLSKIGIIYYPGFLKIGSGFFHTVNMMVYNVSVLGELIKISWKERTIYPISENIVGPLGLFYIIKEAVKANAFLGVLEITEIMGISLIIVNLLPLLPLDGGYIPFLLLEGITKKRVPSKIIYRVTQIGILILAFVFVFVLMQDILRFTAIRDFFCKIHIFC